MPSLTRPEEAPGAVLVGVDTGQPHPDTQLHELHELALSAGLVPSASLWSTRRRIDPGFYVGSGKVDELKQQVVGTHASCVLFDNALSPAQQRNLENALGVPVWDRTALILEIFARRARSGEGKLQVELARLRHAATRLVRGWTHLERQQGGIGLRGGPGEKQIELDRRMLEDKIKVLQVRLHKLERQRSTQRRARARAGQLRVSIVGYTNAGKSTLFNALTHAHGYVANQLFATLDTTTRRIYLAPGAFAVVSDTVGFIRDLPHSLVDAFKATLDETLEADVLLHVVDLSNEQRDQQIEQVNAVLAEIGAQDIPQILVYNKIDKLQAPIPFTDRYAAHAGTGGRDSIKSFDVSALTGAGLDALREYLAAMAAARSTADGHPVIHA
ncbi:GTPase HflX [Thiomonas sp. FB-Cd]|uniref:GTPase HflX n=1 Tax=Thiomonas sp. FB-Cd TaxID=1158292 RepID=UPI001E3A4FBF|nr:GTPase HflX [Thiomonas sp. FB-Cd]